MPHFLDKISLGGSSDVFQIFGKDSNSTHMPSIALAS